MSILLTEHEVVEIAEEHGLCTIVTDAGYKNDALWFDGDKCDFARAIQLALIEKMRKRNYVTSLPGLETGNPYRLYLLPTPQELDES